MTAIQHQNTDSSPLENNPSIFSGYSLDGFYDEMFAQSGCPRPECGPLFERLNRLTTDAIARRQRAAHRSMVDSGITFNVYGDKEGHERIIPFDIMPRVVSAEEWVTLERGLEQRIRALNLFLSDIYGQQRIIRDGVIPEHVIRSAASFRPQCMGLQPPDGIWCHITGTDLVRDGNGRMLVLEDNLRCPSGVSYVVQNRQLVKKTFPQLFGDASIRPVENYPGRLLEALQYLMEDRVGRQTLHC